MFKVSSLQVATWYQTSLVHSLSEISLDILFGNIFDYGNTKCIYTDLTFLTKSIRNT